MNPEIEILKSQIHDLQFQIDRLKHEAEIAKINIESFDRRWKSQNDFNDIVIKLIKENQ